MFSGIGAICHITICKSTVGNSGLCKKAFNHSTNNIIGKGAIGYNGIRKIVVHATAVTGKATTGNTWVRQAIGNGSTGMISKTAVGNNAMRKRIVEDTNSTEITVRYTG